jgi:gluconolactonase
MQTITPTITDITDGLFFPEGPVWCDDGSVLVVELGEGCVTRVQPDGVKTRVSDNGGSPNGQAIGPDGALYVCNSGGWDWVEIGPMRITGMNLPANHSGGRIERVDLATGEVRVLYTECDGNPLIGPNDIVFDRDGGMWFTDHGRHEGRVHHLGGVYYAQPDGSSIRELLFPLDAPNGIGLSPDGTKLYVAETHTGRVRVWDVTAPGQVDTASIIPGPGGGLLHGFEGMQLLDSLGMDADGNVVVATLVTGAVSVIAPDGTLLEQWMTGDLMTTNVCFGGPGLTTAFVTCSATGRLIKFDYPRGGLPLNF